MNTYVPLDINKMLHESQELQQQKVDPLDEDEVAIVNECTRLYQQTTEPDRTWIDIMIQDFTHKTSWWTIQVRWVKMVLSNLFYREEYNSQQKYLSAMDRGTLVRAIRNGFPCFTVIFNEKLVLPIVYSYKTGSETLRNELRSMFWKISRQDVTQAIDQKLKTQSRPTTCLCDESFVMPTKQEFLSQLNIKETRDLDAFQAIRQWRTGTNTTTARRSPDMPTRSTKLFRAALQKYASEEYLDQRKNQLEFRALFQKLEREDPSLYQTLLTIRTTIDKFLAVYAKRQYKTADREYEYEEKDFGRTLPEYIDHVLVPLQQLVQTTITQTEIKPIHRLLFYIDYYLAHILSKPDNDKHIGCQTVFRLMQNTQSYIYRVGDDGSDQDDE